MLISLLSLSYIREIATQDSYSVCVKRFGTNKSASHRHLPMQTNSSSMGSRLCRSEMYITRSHTNITVGLQYPVGYYVNYSSNMASQTASTPASSAILNHTSFQFRIYVSQSTVWQTIF
jgi:hypothetical protein